MTMVERNRSSTYRALIALGYAYQAADNQSEMRDIVLRADIKLRVIERMNAAEVISGRRFAS